MGVKLTEILSIRETDFKQLQGKTIAVDASNWLYQFLSVIRQPDGSPLTDAQGKVTSHLMGLFTRNLKLLQLGINLVYVFDGKAPALKLQTQQKRYEVKQRAEKEYQKAVAAKDFSEMKKYASMTSRLTPEMVQESKELLQALDIPLVQAPSEGEAQAAHLVKKKDAYAVGSQDVDSLLFGAPRSVRNLTFTGKRRTGKTRYVTITPELIDLNENLSHLDISRDQLIMLAMLVGTDYNNGGIPGIGPKKALHLVKKHGNNRATLFEEMKWAQHFSYPWQEVFDIFHNIEVIDNYTIRKHELDKEKIMKLLIDKHNFSEERVVSLLTPFLEFSKKQQKGLGDYFE